MDGHVLAFDRFKGCAKACMYDSQKPVVLRWEGHQPIFNPRFLAFAAHYEFRLEAVRGKPNAKPHVERNFWELERAFLNGRSFRDFHDLKAQLAHWLDHIVDQRRRHGRTSLERFAEEREHLLPLPGHPYDTARVAYRLCSIDGFIDKDFILELARLDFVRRHDDVVITGKAGTGKSHILKACGLRACQQQISLRYARCVDLLDDLHIHCDRN